MPACLGSFSDPMILIWSIGANVGANVGVE